MTSRIIVALSVSAESADSTRLSTGSAAGSRVLLSFMAMKPVAFTRIKHVFDRRVRSREGAGGCAPGRRQPKRVRCVVYRLRVRHARSNVWISNYMVTTVSNTRAITV